MIGDYAIKLIDNMPTHPTNLVLDVILDGGAFNGSYMLGALYFLKELEKRQHIKIDRISGCSIGSLVGFLYVIDSLDSMTDLYTTVYKEIKRTRNFTILKQIKTLLGNKIPEDVCDRLNNVLYITYNNIQKGTKPVKCVYKDADDIINTIVKSSFIPFVTDGSVTYKEKYVDGINPFIFKQEPGKKILYLNLSSFNKIGHIWNIKNEPTNYHRALSGLLDIHHFFIKQSNTEMCSYVEDWSTTHKAVQQLKRIIEFCIVKLVCVIVYIKKFYTNDNYLMYKIFTVISKDIFEIILDTYCL
jgi:hypothetical protein